MRCARVTFQMSSMLLGIADPFLPLENLCSALFLGGILDSLQQMFYGKPKAEEQEESKKNGEGQRRAGKNGFPPMGR